MTQSVQQVVLSDADTRVLFHGLPVNTDPLQKLRAMLHESIHASLDGKVTVTLSCKDGPPIKAVDFGSMSDTQISAFIGHSPSHMNVLRRMMYEGLEKAKSNRSFFDARRFELELVKSIAQYVHRHMKDLKLSGIIVADGPQDITEA